MEVVVLIGLQASGKTTFYTERYAATHALVSKDRMGSARNKEARQRARLEELLAAGRDVVVDNTNVRSVDRASIIGIAREHGARVVGQFFDVPARVCIARNHLRQGKERVPPAAIHRFARMLERPAMDEGFDELHTVSTLTE